jgi:hypothetical protein
MSDYRELYTSFWPWALRHGLDDSARCLGAYLLTCEHRTFEGIYRLPAAYAIADLGWDRQTFDRAFGALVAAGFVIADESADVVFLANALEYRQPKGEKSIRGAVNGLKRLPDTPLLRNLFDAAQEYAQDFALAIEESFPRIAEAPPMPLPVPSDAPSMGLPGPVEGASLTRAQTRTEQTQNRTDTEQTSAQARPPATSLDDARQRLQAEQVRRVFDEWVDATERDPARTKLTDDRRRRIIKALKTHGVEDCVAAVRNIGADKHAEKCARNGYGRQGQRYDDIEHALGDTERIERWRDATPAAVAAPVKRLANTGDFSRFDNL